MSVMLRNFAQMKTVHKLFFRYHLYTFMSIFPAFGQMSSSSALFNLYLMYFKIETFLEISC